MGKSIDVRTIMVRRVLIIAGAMWSINAPASSALSQLTFNDMIKSVADRASAHVHTLALGSALAALYLYSQAWYRCQNTDGMRITPMQLHPLWYKQSLGNIKDIPTLFLQQPTTLPNSAKHIVTYAEQPVSLTNLYDQVTARLSGAFGTTQDPTRDFIWWPWYVVAPPQTADYADITRLQNASERDILVGLLKQIAHTVLRVCSPEKSAKVLISQVVMVDTTQQSIIVSGDLVTDIQNNHDLRLAQVSLLVAQLWSEVNTLIEHLPITNWQRSKLQRQAYSQFTEYMVFVTYLFNIMKTQQAGQWTINIGPTQGWLSNLLLGSTAREPRVSRLCHQADIVRRSMIDFYQNITQYAPEIIPKTRHIQNPHARWFTGFDNLSLMHTLQSARRSLDYAPGFRFEASAWGREITWRASQLSKSS